MISESTREILLSDGPIRVSLSPYTYVRTTVMASTLMTEMDYRKLLKLEIPEIVQFLEESTYKREIDELAQAESGVQLVEHSVQRNFWRAVDKLRRITDERMRFFIDLYIWRNDIENIKTLVRAKRSGVPVDRIKNILMPGTITKLELLDYYEKPTAEDILGALDLPFISDAKEIYLTKGLAALEAAMTHGYYNLTHRIARRIPDESDLFKQYLLLEVDLTNVLTILKLKRTGTEASQIIPYIIDAYADIPTSEHTIQYRAGQQLFSQLLAAKDMEQAVGILERSRLHHVLEAGIAAYRTSGTLLEMEREFQVRLLKRATTLTHQHPLTADVVVSYLLAKVIESRNIMLIIKGKELGLSEQFLEQELVVRS